ncbi:MAG: hypothetical protein AAF846_22185 [Chloroflexota bacterium]
MYVFIVAIIFWWVNFVVRIVSHSRDPQFWRMPWMYLWLNAYIIGLYYMLSHYFILVQLESIIHPVVEFPIVSFVANILMFLHLFSSLIVIQREISINFTTTYILLIVLFCLILANHLLSNSNVDLYRRNSMIIFTSMIVAGGNLFSSLLRHNILPRNQIELAHVMWYLLCAFCISLGHGLIALNSIEGLLRFTQVVETPLQTVGYALNMVSMFALVIMVQPDDILFRTLYPIRLWQLHRLQRLQRFIQRNIHPMEFIRNNQEEQTNQLDARIHATVVAILDYYPYLEVTDPLRRKLWQIEQNAYDLEDMLWHIIRIQI